MVTNKVTTNSPMAITAPSPDVDGLLGVEDLEHEGLGGSRRAAAGEDVDLGEGLEGEDREDHHEEQQRRGDAAAG